MKRTLTLVLAVLTLCAVGLQAADDGESMESIAGRWAGKSKFDSSGLVFSLDLQLSSDGSFTQSQTGESFNTHRTLPRHVTTGQWTIRNGCVRLTSVGRDGREFTNRWTIIENRALVGDRAGYQFTLLRR